MVIRSALTALFALALVATPARAGTIAIAIEQLNLDPVADAALPTVAVPGSEDEALLFAGTIARALAYFERELGWTLEFRLAVLHRPAWEKVSAVPWPAPFVSQDEAYIVMPSTISGYPGFDRWSFEDKALNEVLTVHEIGHALAAAHGLHSANHWLHELIANVFLAGYVLDEDGRLRSLLDGPPAGFGPFDHSHFADLDYLYSGVGLENYAWYQFELARLARAMVAEQGLRGVVSRLKDALDGQDSLLASRAADLLEGVSPVLAGQLDRFSGDSRLPRVGSSPCEGRRPEPDALGTPLIVENASATDLPVFDRRIHEERQKMANGIAAFTGEEPAELPVRPTIVRPGAFMSFYLYEGQEVEIGGGACVVVPGIPSRFRLE